ncbi:MAG: F0F1 ATP synthase subunit epsilon [Dehalococcoidia bacterium]|nr:F0F1 ATP synthase subunit epsilon [Dehalococcoidia bacterium]
MARISLEIITAERVVYSNDVDIVVVPGIEGELAILPQHAALMTMLQPGPLLTKKNGEEDCMFVSGGFMEVQADRVTVLADTAERAEEIDVTRAEEARKRAETRIALPPEQADHARAQAALIRSLLRLKVAEKSRKRRGAGPTQRP